MRCPYCGREVKEGNLFCEGCGAKLENKPVIDPNAFSYQPQYKKNTGLIVTIVILSVLLVAGIIIGVILLTGKSKNSTNNNSNEPYNYIIDDNTEIDEDDIQYIKNIDYKDYVLEDGSILLLLKNNNVEEVTINVDIYYYDENNNFISSDDNALYALRNDEEGALLLYEPDTPYKSYKIKIDAYKNLSYNSYRKDITFKTEDNKTYGELNVHYTNNSNDKLDMIIIGAVFYKDGKMIGFDYDSEYEIEKGQSSTIDILYPYDTNYEDLDFDSYKVYVIDAISYR